MKSLNSLAWSPCKSPKWRAALELLLEAAYYNSNLDRQSYLSVSVSDLKNSGLTQNDILWLIAKGHVELLSKARKSSHPRTKRSNSAAMQKLVKRTRMILTEEGIGFATAICNSWESASADASESAVCIATAVPPRWDPTTRALWVGSCLVKQFKVPASNQELILAAFTEEGWPQTIDDPLPVTHEIDSKDRLHDTIKRLNRGHQFRLIRFRGNGNGQGVRWERIPLSA